MNQQVRPTTRLPARGASGDAGEEKRVKPRHLWIAAVILIAAGAAPAAFLFPLSSTESGTAQRIPTYQVEVVNKYPHDRRAFSQGLVVEGDTLIEGTGQEGESTLREVDLKTGKVKRLVRLAPSVFGEGVTVLNGKIYQLTWKHGLAYVYDRKTMKYEKALKYKGEGWGLTHDGQSLIMSNGTEYLYFLDPKDLTVLRRLKVRNGRRALNEINELEFINGEIFANVWHDDFIYAIDPKSGKVKYKLDLRLLKPAAVRWEHESVLNGIAWEPKTKKLYVTGKDWPVLYEIRIVRPKGDDTNRRTKP